MDTVDETFLSHEHTIAQLCSSTSPPFAVIDDFFHPSTIQALRTEAVRLRDNGHFVTSQSERNGVTYEKHNVEAMQLDGGDQYFDGAWDICKTLLFGTVVWKSTDSCVVRSPLQPLVCMNTSCKLHARCHLCYPTATLI